MLKRSVFFVFLILSHCLWCESVVKKTGKIPSRCPSGVKSWVHFLPYNPVFLGIGTGSQQILDFAELREKAAIYCIVRDEDSFCRLEEETQSLGNTHFFPFNFKASQLTNECQRLGLSTIDVLSLNVPGEELHILVSAQKFIQTARIIFVSTHQRTFKKIQGFLQKQGFTLVSYWEQSNQKGEAFFLKTDYYKGTYERKLI